MAKDVIEICNLAIGAARSSHYIESLEEPSTEAQTCKLVFNHARDYVLGRADWSFARKRAPLLKSGTAPDEWGFRYALPADCITARGVQDGKIVRTLEERVSYAIENDGSGDNRVILMNWDAAVLIYTMRVKNTTLFSPAFDEALIYKIAAALVRPLDKSESICREVMATANTLINSAAANSYNEEKHPPAPPSDLFTSRQGF